MSRPVPGPWTTKVQGEPNQYFTMRGDGRWLAAIQFNGEMTVAEQDATARLIDAAPDLLDALQEMVEIAESQGHHVTKARAALTKATGEQQ